MSQPPFPDPHSFWHTHPLYARSARFAHYSRRGGRFFPRVFWFALGAGAYAWWSSQKDHRQQAIEAYINGQGANGQNGYNHHGAWGWGCQRRRREIEERRTAEGPADVRYDKQSTRAWESDAQLPVPTPLTAPAVPPAYASTAPVEQEKETRQLPSERFREVGRQASDAFADISESALDTLLDNVQALKKKLAETREAREQAYVEQRLPVDHEQMRK